MSETLEIAPIGYLKSDLNFKFELPPQPDQDTEIAGLIELGKGANYEVALRDIDGFSHIWLIWWFHRNKNWRPTTLPPRGRGSRKGTFATRSPYRPNPLAMSCVRLVSVHNHKLYIGAHDLLDGTPILDIKPYMPKFDSIPEATSGWFGEMEAELENSPSYQLDLSGAEISDSLPDDLLRRAERILEKDPFPHRTRRIVVFGDGYRLSCGDWRLFYQVEETTIRVSRILLRDSESSP